MLYFKKIKCDGYLRPIFLVSIFIEKSFLLLYLCQMVQNCNDHCSSRGRLPSITPKSCQRFMVNYTQGVNLYICTCNIHPGVHIHVLCQECSISVLSHMLYGATPPPVMLIYRHDDNNSITFNVLVS